MLEQKPNSEQKDETQLPSSQNNAKPDVVRSAYYTPVVEELHIGFECELLYQSDNNLARTENYKWHSVKLDKNNFQRAYSLIKDNKIRVRLLCKTDIEDLGFQSTVGLNEDGGCFHNAQKFTVFLSPAYTTNEVDCRHVFITYKINDMLGKKFVGKLKNKSELKKVLQQTGCVLS